MRNRRARSISTAFELPAGHPVALVHIILILSLGISLDPRNANAGILHTSNHIPEAQLSLKKKCTSNLNRTFGAALVTSATWIPGDDTEPEHCAIVAIEITKPQFEISALLPTSWTREIVQTSDSARTYGKRIWTSKKPLREGLVVIASDFGYTSLKVLKDNPEGMIDYSYRGVGTTYEFAKALVTAYYEKDADKSYYIGCSKGGMDAMKAATLYADDFDGVVAQAPAPHIDSFFVRAADMAASPKLSAEKWQAIRDAYVSECDGLDGLKDGVVSNWAACKFDGANLPFLTPEEARTVRRLTSDLRLKDGTLVNRGYWWGPQSVFFNGLGGMGRRWMSYVVGNYGDHGEGKFELDAYWRRVRDIAVRYSLNVDPNALATFLRRGKKMLVFMGIDDPALSVEETVEFQREVESFAGTARINTRMYLMPGVDHCGIREPGMDLGGAETADMLGALRKWVKKGDALLTLTAAHVDANGTVVNTRPLCTLGSYPRYRGTGDPNSAGSFVCEPDPPSVSVSAR